MEFNAKLYAKEFVASLTPKEKRRLRTEFIRLKGLSLQNPKEYKENLLSEIYKLDCKIKSMDTKQMMLYGGIGLAVTAASCLIAAHPVIASDMSKLDAGGEKILGIVQRIGYWIILVKCISDLIKHGLQGELQSIGRTIMMYILLYGALFFVPFALRLIEDLFI